MKNKEGYPGPTYYRAVENICWEELQKQREVLHNLKRGEIITIQKEAIDQEAEGRPHKRKIKMRLRILELYRYVVLTETPLGIRQCYSYWDIDKNRVDKT